MVEIITIQNIIPSLPFLTEWSGDKNRREGISHKKLKSRERIGVELRELPDKEIRTGCHFRANHCNLTTKRILRIAPPDRPNQYQDSASAQFEILPVSSILNNGNKGAEKRIIRRGKIFTQRLSARNKNAGDCIE
jgi:hypothetical protein